MKRIFRHVAFWVLIGAIIGAVTGAGSDELGGSDGWWAGAMTGLKGWFITVLMLLIAPVVFFSLIAGVLQMRRAAGLSRMGGLTLAYYLTTTGIATCIGLLAVLVIHPWTAFERRDPMVMAGAEPVAEDRLLDADRAEAGDILSKIGSQILVDPWEAATRPSILALMVYALLIGVLLSILCSPEHRVVKGIFLINQWIARVLTLVIWLAPLGVMAVVFEFTRSTDGMVFGQLLSFALLVLVATAVHGVVVLPLIAWWFGGIRPQELLKKIATPLLVATSTASSAATLPVTLKTCREELDVEPEVSGFVCPMGATMNMDGTALFEGIAAVFLAHLFGVELTSGGVLAIFIMAMVSSIGAPGMPSASMAGMQMVLLAAGIPLEAIAILLVIERPLDTFRTAVNVEGDIVGAVVVNRYYGRHYANETHAA